jgi:hypothetical protein
VRGAEAELVGEADELGEAVACIFRMTCRRCILTVISLTPSSPAICLLSRPAMDQAQDLALAGGQGLEAGPQLGKPYLVGPADAVLFERDANRIEQILVAERLGQKLDGARLHRPHRHRDIAIARNEDDRQRRVRGGNLPLHVEPAAARETNIEHNAARPVRRSLCRNSCGELNSSTSSPTERKRLSSALRTDASSSITTTVA